MKAKHPAHYMGSLIGRGFRCAPCIIILIFLMSNFSSLIHSQIDEKSELENSNSLWLASKGSSGDIDVPSWRVGDQWTYSGVMNVQGLLQSSGVSSNIQTITGDLYMEVDDIITMNVENQTSLVYRLESEAEFEANNVNLDSYSGDLTVDYKETDYIRVSDGALIQMTLEIDVSFLAFGFINVDVGEMIITNEYSPPKELYDFPIRVGETWSNQYTNSVTWSGQSNYFSIPPDTVDQASSSHAVVSQGNPSVQYSGCANSYNVTSYDSNGTPDGFQWFCPAVNNDAWRHIEVALGLEIDFKLISVQPVSRSTNIDVEFDYPAWPLDTNLSAWVNVSDSSGSPIGGQVVEFRYECVGYSTSLTTASNGSAYIVFDTNHSPDPSPGPDDFSSHGVIAWISAGKKVGVDTITLDDDLTTIDYLPKSSGVSVERVRDGNSVFLNPIIGYNAIPDDTLIFTIPVQNVGILGGPQTELEVTSPDGVTSRANIPPLGALESAQVQLTWNVPPNQAIGDIEVQFEVDPDGLMTEDGNQSNDATNFSIFIGRLPVANLVEIQPTKTLTQVMIDARNSNDPDGGSPHCTFVVEINVATNQTFEEEDCLFEYNWSDDGTYRVWLTITDDENDQDSIHMDIEILNRPPWVNLTTQNSILSIPVESSITFMATDSGDLDSLLPEGSNVDYLWQLPTASDGTQYVCESGILVAPSCKVTPMEEGIFTPEVIVEDDDGAFTSSEFNLVVTNIAPTNAEITMWNGSEQITDDRNPPIWDILEDQVVTLKGTAHDSLNDRSTLTWGWQPDVDVDPNWYVENVGESSEIDVSWNTSGSHVIAMEAIDDDGESSGIANGWVRVSNVAPTVEQFQPLLPVGEDRELTLTGVFSDTPSDLETLEVCWDVDFVVDLDENGDTMDDCDFVGPDITYHWPTAGLMQIRFHVTDDDGDSAEAIVNVTVVNLKPKAAASPEKLTVRVGEELVIWTNETTDSSSDIPNLIFNWDFDSSADFDDDGDPLNDIQAVTQYGEPLRHTFAKEGTKNIRLTVFDENDTNPSTVDIIITVIPDDSGVLGWVDSNTAGVSNIVVILGLVLVALLIVLGFSMLRNKDGGPEDWMISSGLYNESSPTAAPPTYAFGETAATTAPAVVETPAGVPPQETAQLQTPEPVQQPVASTPAPLLDTSSLDDIFAAPAAPSPVVSSGPPLPVGGLPDGWTMEQWEHYGEQWLKDQAAQSSDTGGFDFDL